MTIHVKIHGELTPILLFETFDGILRVEVGNLCLFLDRDLLLKDVVKEIESHL